MDLSKIKCIVVDVDGTLTDNGTLNLKAIEKLREVKSKLNIKIILASGNAYPVLMGIAKYIGGIDLVIAENGAVIGFESNIEVIGNKSIGEKAREIINKELSNILIESWQCKYRLIDFAFRKRDESISWEYMYKKVSEILEEKLPEAKAVFSGVAIHVSDRNVNKGIALKRVMEIANLKKEEVMAIGDSDVDVEMLMEAGIGIAVANASEKAKKVAKIITSKNSWEGFVEIIEILLKHNFNT
ncbi:MAG: phosphoglycolate phosphatase [Candidatus Methanomethylicia archaeon]|nr:phosphoglycolate phosphatase [Candidatus Methanomethylicia archaeon]MDW7988502.1 phosphoglycolate phosphatase [Nitrososphaerota archaeon]